MYPGDQKTGLTLNTQQVLRIDDEPEPADVPCGYPGCGVGRNSHVGRDHSFQAEYRCHFRG
jgi:hypothetical protein